MAKWILSHFYCECSSLRRLFIAPNLLILNIGQSVKQNGSILSPSTSSKKRSGFLEQNPFHKKSFAFSVIHFHWFRNVLSGIAQLCPQATPVQKNSPPKDFGAKIRQSVSSFQRELLRQNKILSSVIWLKLKKREFVRAIPLKWENYGISRRN